jgi:TrmH family RNA methyltransferase
LIDDIKDKRIQHLLKLKTNKGRRNEYRYLLESPFIVNEALKARPDLVVEVFATNDLMQPGWTEISDDVANELSDTYSPQKVFAEMKIVPSDSDLIKDADSGKWILLDGVQDPGNVGTIVRTANAAGYTGVVMSRRTADIYSPKVLRAMKGANYKLQVQELDLPGFIENLKSHNVPVFGTLVNENAKDYRTVGTPENFAFILGNEGQGMSKELADITDENLYIPMIGDQESLNVAIAGAIVMYRLANG